MSMFYFWDINGVSTLWNINRFDNKHEEAFYSVIHLSHHNKELFKTKTK